MSTPPDRPKPPKLVPGEPLWGTPEISPPEQRPPAANRPAKQKRGSNPSAVTGSARPPVGHANATPPPQPGPVQFGAAPGAAAPPSGYGRATTYGGEPRGGYQSGGPPMAGRQRSTGPLIATAVVCLLIGLVTGLAVGWLFF